ncbi:hypothetical protein BU15DRAFT_67530 [Melanogaster broomeanus]|nr:hypothetical protein BU15DRAFT_67530 [Melanogaster broomeanus]
MLLDTPLELICHILSFLSPREIVRLRRTSKQFHDITYNRAIWKTVYANAPLLRPAGPFPYQSTQFLEHTLIHSERVAQTWTSQPVKTISRVLEPKIPCEDPRWTVLVAGTQPGSGGQTTLKLLEFEVDDNSCTFSGPVSMDIPRFTTRTILMLYLWSVAVCVHPWGASSASMGHAHSNLSQAALVQLWIGECMNELYESKLTSITLQPQVASLPIQPQLILSKTHVIVLHEQWSLSDYDRPATTILQAFVVPDSLPHSDSEGIRELRLTHEASMEHMFSYVRLLHDSVCDPVTKATNLRILNHLRARGDGSKYTCIDLTLPELSPDNVLPMSVDSQYLFNSDREIVFASTDSSDDGHLRGVSGSPSMPAKKDALLWLGNVVQWVVRTPRTVIRGRCEFDGVRGRIYYTEKADREDCRNLVVVEPGIDCSLTRSSVQGR